LSDANGLALAYASPDGLHVSGDTLYVSGTRTYSQVSQNPFHEWMQDALIPFGGTSHLDRFQSASNHLFGIQRVVGHSMGGSVALELQKRYPDLTATTYNAPVVSFSGGDRFRDQYDPISFFDRGAQLVGYAVPHSFDSVVSRSRFSR